MNNKGYFTASTLLIVITASLLIMGLFYLPLLNSSFSMKNTFNSIEVNINSRNGVERIYSLLHTNIAHSSEVEYNDIGMEYQFIDKEVNHRKISLNNSGGSYGYDTFSEKFKVINPTNIVIDLNFTRNIPFNEDEVNMGYYSVTLKHEKQGVVFESEDIESDKVITIPSSYLYNETNGTNNYGEYTLIVSLFDCSVDASIEYDELFYRKIELVENENSKRYIVIENNTSNNNGFQMYFVNE